MDRKAILAAITCIAALFLLNKVVDRIYPPKPAPVASTNHVAPAARPGGTNGSAFVAPSMSAATRSLPVVTGSAPAQTFVLTNENARYTFTSRGGGLETVELTQYPETIKHRKKSQQPESEWVTLNTPVAAPVLAVLGDEAVQGDGIFDLTRTASGVRAEKVLANGVRVVKEFELSSNYLVQATVRFENTSSKELLLPAQEWVAGTATPTGPNDDGMAVGLMWYDGSKNQQTLQSWFDNKSFMCTPTLPRTEYRAGASNVVWVAAENQFFVLAAMPAEPAEQVVSRSLELPRPTDGRASLTNNPVQRGFETVLVYPAFALAPGQIAERKIAIYAGPKEYRTLARIANRFQNNVDQVMGFGSWFGIFSKALLLAMNALVQIFHLSYGWAIIAITVIIKLLFWPLTAASMRTAKRMAAFQPQMKVLQDKYKEDPMKLQKKMSEFWKEHKIHPMNGCLPMLVQIPVFIGLYGMIRTAIELRGAHFFWIADLSQPDTLYTVVGLGFIPFMGIPGVGLPLNPLPIIYIVTALWQSHMTPMSPGMDPAQQKMMRWMPLMFLVILYNFSSGLALYMTVQNLLTILQMKLMKSYQPAIPATTAAPALTHPPKKAK